MDRDDTLWLVAAGMVVGAAGFWWWNYGRSGKLYVLTWSNPQQEFPQEFPAQTYDEAMRAAMQHTQAPQNQRVQVVERIDHMQHIMHEWERTNGEWVRRRTMHPRDNQLPAGMQRLTAPADGVIDVEGEVIG